jgi:aminoglycoside phosphotransferase
VVSLPDERLAWFPINEQGRIRLNVERRVLRLLAERCSFRIPGILFESEAGWDLRAIVPGDSDPKALYDSIRQDQRLARRIGRELGLILAEQHTRVAEADVGSWLPSQPAWPEPNAWIGQRLPDVLDDKELLAEIDRVLAAYEAVVVDPKDRVLVHGDLGVHNLAVDPKTADLVGLFDYGEACWADRHHDFRYLVCGQEQEPLLEAALSVYEPATGRTLSRERIQLYNAMCAVCFLAFRHGVAPDRVHCGRTLVEDVNWVRCAITGLASMP